MSYVNSANRPNPVAALGALGVPAGFGVLLVIGLAVTARVPIPVPNPSGIFVPVDPVVEPKVEPKTDPTTQTQTRQDPVYIPPPTPAGPIVINTGTTGPITAPPVTTGDWVTTVDPGPISVPSPSPTLNPITAQPRGNPGGWITDADYRTTWIRRGYSGQAGFALTIDESGRVSDCTITRSTGHAALDEATCRLLQRRARFEPARDASGSAIIGRYTSTVAWQIPE